MAVDQTQNGRVGRGTGKTGVTAAKPVPVPVKAPMGGYRRGNSVAGPDIEVAREYIAIAHLALAPAELSQRQAFKALLPDIYMLRNKGYSFIQIVKLLSECCSFTIQPSTARGYFNEMLVGREDECLRRLNESIMVLAEQQRAAKDGSMSSLASKVAAVREAERRRSDATARVDKALGLSGQSSRDGERAQSEREVAGKAGTGTATTAEPREAASPPGPKKPETGAKSPVSATPAPPAFAGDADGDATAGGGNKGQAVISHISGDVPQTALTSVLRCGPLQSGVKPCKPSKGVPPNIYEEGNFEHPAVPGLMLTLPERLFGAYLEIIDEDSVTRLGKNQFRVPKPQQTVILLR
jgi:hypothetical protein